MVLLMLKSQYEKTKEKSIARKRMWIKSWIARRNEQGYFRNLFLELQLEDPEKYRRYIYYIYIDRSTKY